MRRFKGGIAALIVVTLLAGVTPPASAGLLDPLKKVIDQILPGSGLGGILDQVDAVLDETLSGVTESLDGLGLGLSDDVGSLVDGLVAAVSDTTSAILDPVAPQPPSGGLAPPVPGLELLRQIEVLDGVIEDVLHPAVLAPVSDGLEPVVGALRPALVPLEPVVDTALDAVYGALGQVLNTVGLGIGAYEARVTGPAGTEVRTGVVDVPTVMDATGDGVPDLTIEVRVITARPSIRVSRLPGAPANLPVRVEAVISPGGSSRLSVGFDALSSTLPEVVRATIVDDGTTTGNLAVELHTVTPGDEIALLAAMYDTGPSGPIDPTEIRVGFSPVPTDVTASVVGALAGGGGGPVAVTLDQSSAAEVTAAVSQTAGPVRTTLAAIIDQAPTHVSLGITPGGSGVTVAYEASAPVDRIALGQTIEEPARTRSVTVGIEGIEATSAQFSLDPENALGVSGSAPIDTLTVDAFDSAGLVGRATTLRLRIEGLPTDLDFTLGEDEITLDANGDRIDLLEVMLSSGPDPFLPAGTDGVVLRDTAATFVVAARLTGLRRITAVTTGDVSATIETDGDQPFVVDAATGDTAITARIDRLPRLVSIGAGADGLTWSADRVVDRFEATLVEGTRTALLNVTAFPAEVALGLGTDAITWSASSATPELLIELVDPDGVFDRATSIRLAITDLPTGLSASLAGGGVDLTASAPIGAIEVLATSGPELALPDGAEGIVMRDDGDTQVVAARITGLRRLALQSDPVLLTLGTDAPRPFTIDVEQPELDLLAAIEDLPTEITVGFAIGSAGATNLTYQANAVVDVLTASLDSESLDATLRIEDLPTTLDFTLGEEAFGYTASGPIPLLHLDAGDPGGIAGRATRLAVRAEDLPAAAGLSLTDGRPELTIPPGAGAIGLLEALLTNGPEVSVAPGADGLYLRDIEGGDYVIAARITGLRGLGLDPTGTGISLQTLGGRSFDIDLVQTAADGSSTAALASLDSLPDDIELALGALTEGLSLTWRASSILPNLTASLVTTTPDEPDVTASLELEGLPTQVDLAVAETGEVAYTASSSLPRLAVALDDPAGVFGTATTLVLEALDLPTGLTAALDAAGGLTLSTDGGAIGELTALITDGLEIGLPANTDGLILRDTAAGFAVAVHLTELRSLSFSTVEGGADLSLGTDGGRPLVVDAELEDEEDGSTTDVLANLSALPSTISLELRQTPTVGADGEPAEDLAVTYSASSSLATLIATLALGDPVEGTTEFGLTAIGVPTAFSLAVNAGGVIEYSADGPLGQLLVAASDPAGIFAGATDLQARLDLLPLQLSIGLGEDGDIRLDAHAGTLGLLEAAATTGSGGSIPIDPDKDGIVLVDQPGEFGAFLRIRGLHLVEVVPDPIAVRLDTVGGRVFVLDATLRSGGVLAGEIGDVDIDAVLDALPESVTLGFVPGDLQQLSLAATARIAEVAFALAQYPEGGGAPLTAAVLIDEAPTALDLGISLDGNVSYTAAQRVPSLSLDAFDPAGLFDRADELHIRLTDLPPSFDMAVSPDGAMTIDAAGSYIGLLEIQATTGPDDRLPVERDGALFEDLTSKFVVFARFTRLRTATVTQTPLPNLSITTDGFTNRPLDIRLFESDPTNKPSPRPGELFTTVLLENMPSSVHLALLPGAPGTLNVEYSANQTATRLSFTNNAGDRWQTTASISDPVPLSFTACQTGTSGCLPSPGLGQTTANIGSFAFVANQFTTLNVLDCAAPLNANCTQANGTKVTAVNNLRVKTFYFGGDINQGTVQAAGRLYANTVPVGLAYNQANADTVSGSLYNRDGSTRMNFTFSSTFEAWDRYRRFDRFPGIPLISPGPRFFDTRGGIVCSGGTNMSVTVNFIFDLTFNATSLLC